MLQLPITCLLRGGKCGWVLASVRKLVTTARKGGCLSLTELRLK